MEPDLGKVSRVKLGEKARRELVRWAIGLGIVAVFMGVISAFGGFKPLPGPHRFVEPGVAQDLGRWRISVNSAEFTDRNPSSPDVPFSEPKVLVHLTVTNLTKKPLCCLDETALQVILPTGEKPSMFGAPLYSLNAEGDFDPGITRDVWLQFEPTEGTWNGDQTVRVRMGYEEPSDSYIYSDRYETVYEVGAVDVRCKDTRR